MILTAVLTACIVRGSVPNVQPPIVAPTPGHGLYPGKRTPIGGGVPELVEQPPMIVGCAPLVLGNR